MVLGAKGRVDISLTEDIEGNELLIFYRVATVNAVLS